LYLQAALLYTTSYGARRIRVHNMRLVGTESIQVLFRHADIDTILAVMIRQAALSLTSTNSSKNSIQALQTTLNDHAIDMLYSYRKHCAASSSPGQLILPESLKLLPLYLSSLYKTPMFSINRPYSGSLTNATDSMLVRADSRNASLVYLSSLTAARFVPFIYPRLFILHNLGGWVCRKKFSFTLSFNLLFFHLSFSFLFFNFCSKDYH
jgi:protein transport protein SEC24